MSEILPQATYPLFGADCEPLTARRRQGWQHFVNHGLVHKRVENWKYTPLDTIWRNRVFTPTAKGATTSTSEPSCPHIIRLSFVDGRLDQANSDLNRLPSGVTVLPLAEAGADIWRELADLEVDFDYHRMAAVNTALMSDGAWIMVDANVELTCPIVIDYSSSSHTSSHYRNHIVLGANASATIIERPMPQASALTNVITTTDCQPGSRYYHYALENQCSLGHHISGLHIKQLRDSRSFCFHMGLHNELARYDVHSHLLEAGSECQANGVYNLSGASHSDHHVLVEHKASHTRSDQLYKGVVADKARAVFNGKAIVHRGTCQVSAHQHNHNLLLSKRAQVDTKPELEIYAEDVICTHGATVGQLDPAQLFFLQSRGLPRSQAIDLLTQAFINSVVDTIEQTSVLNKFFSQRLGTAELGELQE